MRLAREHGRPLSTGEVHRWLNRKGFSYIGDWTCKETCIQHLQPGEIDQILSRQTVNNITFVIRSSLDLNTEEAQRER